MEHYSNIDCEYFLKEVEDKFVLEYEDKIKYIVFVVNRNTPLTDRILEKMSKYDYVEFDNYFNQPIDNLPVGLKSIILGNYFDQPVDNLPSGLQNLTIKSNLTHPIDNLPSGLQSLTFDNYFNQPIYNLPLGLENLYLSDNYDKPLNNLPTSVKITRI